MSKHTLSDEVIIEPITEPYYESKAEVHSQTWRETYEGVQPQWLIDRITPEFALQVTRRHDPNTIFIARIGQEILGFAEYCIPARKPIAYADCAELASIYVLQNRQGRGIGSALLHAVQQAVPTERIALWMFAGNRKADAFYRTMGFHQTGHELVEDDGASRSIEYVNF
jgi:GNAT superfamily N-acetyltransferase